MINVSITQARVSRLSMRCDHAPLLAPYDDGAWHLILDSLTADDLRVIRDAVDGALAKLAKGDAE